MERIPRIKQEIFAKEAGSRQITAFGTAKNETPEYTTDLNKIQNTNFLQGWLSAILPDKAPYEEDTNALFYTITTQLAYLFQEGFPEYNSQTVYFAGSLVKNIDSEGNITIYKSLVDNNIGNPVTDDNYWRVYLSDSSTGIAMYEIGLPQPTLSNTLLSNEIWLEGQEVSRTNYANLFAIYGTTYGAGDGSTTFNLPDFRNRVIWGATSFGYINAGLPNITGTFTNCDDDYATGAFYVTDQTVGTDDGSRPQRVYGFDASRSSAVYGGSTTVQPPAIKCRIKTRFQ